MEDTIGISLSLDVDRNNYGLSFALKIKESSRVDQESKRMHNKALQIHSLKDRLDNLKKKRRE